MSHPRRRELRALLRAIVQCANDERSNDEFGERLRLAFRSGDRTRLVTRAIAAYERLGEFDTARALVDDADAQDRYLAIRALAAARAARSIEEALALSAMFTAAEHAEILHGIGTMVLDRSGARGALARFKAARQIESPQVRDGALLALLAEELDREYRGKPHLVRIAQAIENPMLRTTALYAIVRYYATHHAWPLAAKLAHQLPPTADRDALFGWLVEEKAEDVVHGHRTQRLREPESPSASREIANAIQDSEERVRLLELIEREGRDAIESEAPEFPPSSLPDEDVFPVPEIGASLLAEFRQQGKSETPLPLSFIGPLTIRSLKRVVDAGPSGLPRDFAAFDSLKAAAEPLIAARDINGAIALAASVRERSPLGHDAYLHWLGRRLASDGAPTHALAAADAISSASPNARARVVLELVRVLSQRGDRGRARDLAEELCVQWPPMAARAFAILASVALASGNGRVERAALRELGDAIGAARHSRFGRPWDDAVCEPDIADVVETLRERRDAAGLRLLSTRAGSWPFIEHMADEIEAAAVRDRVASDLVAARLSSALGRSLALAPSDARDTLVIEVARAALERGESRVAIDAAAKLSEAHRERALHDLSMHWLSSGEIDLAVDAARRVKGGRWRLPLHLALARHYRNHGSASSSKRARRYMAEAIDSLDGYLRWRDRASWTERGQPVERELVTLAAQHGFIGRVMHAVRRIDPTTRGPLLLMLLDQAEASSELAR